MTQLSLLEWTPPRKVIVFPVAKRIGKVRRTAEMLVQKQGNGAVTYWRQVCSALAAQLERSGATPDERDAELKAFFDAVQAEMMRMAYGNQRPGGGAA